MRKLIVALILVLAMAGSVFALGDIEIDNHPTTTVSPSVTQNPTINNKPEFNNNIGNGFGNFSPSASAKIEKGAVDIDNHNTNIGIQTQKQIGINSQNNKQVIAPEQTVTFKSPTQLLAPPSQGLSELNFGNGRMKDVTKGPYKFALFGIQEYNGEPIREVLYTDANVKIKNYFQAVLDAGKKVSSKEGFKSNETKIIVIEAEAQKSWTTGGNLGGAGSAVPTSGLAGGSMAGSVIPQWGGTKADDLRNIFIVKVALPPTVILYEKK